MPTMTSRLLVGSALTVVALGVIGWRSLEPTGPSTSGPIPNPELTALLPYATPLSDSVIVPQAHQHAVVLPRDPFTPVPAARLAASPVAASNVAANRRREPKSWAVSATLTVGARRAAIIDDVLMYIGDTLPGGATLTVVEHDWVVLTDAKGSAHTVVVKEGGR